MLKVCEDCGEAFLAAQPRDTACEDCSALRRESVTFKREPREPQVAAKPKKRRVFRQLRAMKEYGLS